SRSGTKPFMQAADGPPPPCVGGAGANDAGLPASGAAPPDGNGEAGGAPTSADALAPLTGGDAGAVAIPPDWLDIGAAWLGSGAGNAPCASADPAWKETAKAASVSGTIKRWIIKAVSPARSNGPNCPESQCSEAIFRSGLFTIPAGR